MLEGQVVKGELQLLGLKLSRDRWGPLNSPALFLHGFPSPCLGCRPLQRVCGGFTTQWKVWNGCRVLALKNLSG